MKTAEILLITLEDIERMHNDELLAFTTQGGERLRVGWHGPQPDPAGCVDDVSIVQVHRDSDWNVTGVLLLDGGLPDDRTVELSVDDGWALAALTWKGGKIAHCTLEHPDHTERLHLFTVEAAKRAIESETAAKPAPLLEVGDLLISLDAAGEQLPHCVISTPVTPSRMQLIAFGVDADVADAQVGRAVFVRRGIAKPERLGQLAVGDYTVIRGGREIWHGDALTLRAANPCIERPLPKVNVLTPGWNPIDPEVGCSVCAPEPCRCMCGGMGS